MEKDKVSRKFTDIAKSQRKYVEGAGNTGSSPKIAYIVVAVLLVLSITGFVVILSNKDNKEESTPDEAAAVETEETQDDGDSMVNNDDTDDENEEETVSDIDVSDKSDSTDVENAPGDESFTNAEQEVGDSSETEVVLAEMTQTGFDTFMRIEYPVEEGGIPRVTATAIPGSNLIRLRFEGIAEDNSGIQIGKEVEVKGSVVSRIIHDVNSEEGVSKYSIGIYENTPFYLHTTDDSVILDIKEVELESTEDTSEETEYSSNQQVLEGTATGNVVWMNRVSHKDQPDENLFRITFEVGSSNGVIPNAQSEIVDYEGGKAIKLEIQNMNSDFAAENDYDETYGNWGVEGMKGSFADNTSTYYIILKGGERDYKLYSETAPNQVIIDVKR